MKILVFTEGTILMHPTGVNVSRGERVMQVQRKSPDVKEYGSYIPVENAPQKLKSWKDLGAEICYLTSRDAEQEIEDIRKVLKNNNFPEGELYFRKPGEQYKDVAERVVPDILIEDDCESIGGEAEMTYPHIKDDLKQKMKSIPIKEFGGIDHLPDDINNLQSI
jgi:hypothetical protein